MKNICEVCGKDVDYLIKKGPYNGNKDDREMCEHCFEEIHGE